MDAGRLRPLALLISVAAHAIFAASLIVALLTLIALIILVALITLLITDSGALTVFVGVVVLVGTVVACPLVGRTLCIARVRISLPGLAGVGSRVGPAVVALSKEREPHHEQ